MRKQVPLDHNGDKWVHKGRIQFIDYSVRYRPDTQIVLDKINVTINPGENIGVVGRTGAGKSTLCLAICRFLESNIAAS